MIVWGGVTHRSIFRTGADTIPLAILGRQRAPQTRRGPVRSHGSVDWHEMIVWGGSNDVNDFNTGGSCAAASAAARQHQHAVL
jgi:hypothetical protein